MNLTAFCNRSTLNFYKKVQVFLKSKFFLVMKLTSILLFAACLQVSASGYGQAVTISGRNMALKNVFGQIQKQTGYLFFYSDGDLKNAEKVTIDVKDMDLIEVMDQIFQNQNLSYIIIDKTIVVKEKDAPRSIDVKGRVVDDNGNSVTGASVFIEGTKTGTTTDANGYFELDNVNENSILIITGTNIETIQIKVSGKNFINVTVKIKVSALDQVQIIGYGKTTRRFSTSTIATVKGEDIETRPVTNVFQALQGMASGVAITNASPGIGAPVQLTIRGVNSLQSGTNPLIIIDGVIINENPGGLITSGIDASSTDGGANTYQEGNSVLNMINPNDIASIDILKDADATSIYGSRGTNGVILITTKQGEIGATKVSVNVSTGWKSPIGVTKRLNTAQYLQVRKDAFATGNMTATSVINPITPTNLNAPDLLLWSQTAYTDYPKMELGQPAPNYNADVSISGGTKALNFMSSASYTKMYDTYFTNPYLERGIGRLRLNHVSSNNKFSMSINSIFGIEKQTFYETGFSTVLGTANANAPNFELYKSDGSLEFGAGQGYVSGSYYNPIPNSFMNTVSKTGNLLLSSSLSYEIMKGLKAKAVISYSVQSNKYDQLYPSTAVNIQNQYEQLPWGTHTSNVFTSLNIEPQLTYTGKIAKGTITALAGATWLDEEYDRTLVKVNNPGSDDLLSSYSSGNPTTVGSDNNYTRFNSVFGRVNYNWDTKYIANVSFRRDGSSKFGPENRFANFAAAGLAWIFTQEKFAQNNLSFLSYGKLRGSYGTTGNDNIADYLYLSLLQAPTSNFSGNYNGLPGLNPANLPNPAVQWEITAKRDFGLELGFLNNRILFNTTYYKSKSDNLLNSSLPIPPQTGFDTFTGNFEGTVENTGWEFELTTKNLGSNSPVSWTTRFNITRNENKLTKFPGLENSPFAKTLEVGRALASNSLSEMPFHFTGINPDNGLPQFVDLNKDGKVNEDDYETNINWIGTARPTTWGGLTNTVSYKGFSLDIFVQFSNGIFTKWNYLQPAIGTIYNPSTDVISNYWMKPGDVKKYPRLYTGVPGTADYTNPITSYYPFSTANIFKGYYFRLKNVQLSYNLPKTLLSKIKMNNAVIYISGENLAVYTKEKLYKDPEVFWGRSAGLLRTITTGLRLTF